MKNYKFLFFLLVLFFFFSCLNEEELPVAHLAQRTVLIYIAADNNLYKQAEKDIEEMLLAEVPKNNHLIVYLDTPFQTELYEIKQGEIIFVKQYEPQNSASPEILELIIKETILLFPAESYGLVLWSHGTGWLPENTYKNFRSFGKDKQAEMSIIELEKALPLKFDFIIFDACLMGGIEVLYQLRNKADVIISSPTETLATGFPYNETVPFFWGKEPYYVEIAQTYMNYYRNKLNPILQSASIAVIETKQLSSLANSLKNVIIEDQISFIYSDKDQIQKYELKEQVVYYDLLDFFKQSVSKSEYIEEIQKKISDIVIYSDFTPFFLNELAITNSCGISIFISSNPDLIEDYMFLDWYIDSQLLYYWK